MSASVPISRRLVTTATWPVGVGITTWRYIWRTTPIYRHDLDGSLGEDLPPALPAGVTQEEVQGPPEGSGPLFHRLYSGAIRNTDWGPERLMANIKENPNRFVPRSMARFQKTGGERGELVPGDEFLVRMPGPWDGPIRVVHTTPGSFRFATLASHLEAGQIEWRAFSHQGLLHFQVESWARAGDRFSAVMHDRLRMAKEVQLLMWSSVVELVARRSGGKLVRGVEIETRRVDGAEFQGQRPRASAAAPG